MSLPKILDGAAVLPPLIPAAETPTAPSKTDPGIAAPRKRTRADGRFQMLNTFVDSTMCDLTPRQVAVWMCLYRDVRNGFATSAHSYVAKRCGLRRPTVSTTISELAKLGLVEILHRGGLNRGLSKYRVCGTIRRGGRVSKR